MKNEWTDKWRQKLKWGKKTTTTTTTTIERVLKNRKRTQTKKKWSKHLKGYSFLHFTLCCFFRARLIKRGVKPVSLTLFAELNLHIHITYIRREIEREKWKENYFCMMAKPTARIEQKKKPKYKVNSSTTWHDTTWHSIS